MVEEYKFLLPKIKSRKSSVQEEDTFRHRNGFKFKEETSEMLNLEHSSL